MRSIVSAKWHLIVHDTLGDQIYDWARDPGESTDLISTSEGKAAALSLKSEMETLTNEPMQKK